MDANKNDSEKAMGEQRKKAPAESRQSGSASAGGIALLLFLAAFLLGFSAIGAGLCYSAHMRKKVCSAEAEGKIIEYMEKSRTGRKHMFTPVVEYEVGNKIFTGNTKAWSSSRTFKTGEYVMIGYNPANPEEFYIKNYDLSITTRLGILFLVISGGILVVTVIVLILDKSKMDKGKKKVVKTGIFVSGIAFLIFVVFMVVAGLTITLCVFGGMGLFALYGWFRDKRRNL